jgi:hypothetical protein
MHLSGGFSGGYVGKTERKPQESRESCIIVGEGL